MSGDHNAVDLLVYQADASGPQPGGQQAIRRRGCASPLQMTQTDRSSLARGCFPPSRSMIDRRRMPMVRGPELMSPLSSGPPTWEKHDTLWRLVYRRIEL